MNRFILEKKPSVFEKMVKEENVLHFQNEELLIEGSVVLDEIYACLYCKELKNITLLIKGEQIQKITLLFGNEMEYEQCLNLMKACGKKFRISEQNNKINGYGAALFEKLKEGIAVTIMDTKQEKEVLMCPMCGVQCDPNIPYCMECGACI